MSVLGLTKEEAKLAAELIWDRLKRGHDDESIMADIGLDETSYNELRSMAVMVAADEFRGRSAEETFIEYLIAQRRCMTDLATLAQALTSEDKEGNTKVTQASAFVSAIRARSEIHDKVLKFGQDLGIVKAGADGSIVPGVNVNSLSSRELRSLVTREVARLDQLMKMFGTGSIKDVEVGGIYQSAEGAEVKKHARNPVNRGRRVIKK